MGFRGGACCCWGWNEIQGVVIGFVGGGWRGCVEGGVSFFLCFLGYGLGVRLGRDVGGINNRLWWLCGMLLLLSYASCLRVPVSTSRTEFR